MDEDGSVDIIGFDKTFDRAGFSCGKPDLDHWLQKVAGQSDRANTTRTFLAVEGGSPNILGYYATKAYELDLDEAAAAYGVGKRRYPVPAMLLARLAVDESYQGRGVGQKLLVHALGRLVDVSYSIGFEIIVVDAIDVSASTFYRRYGFTAFEDEELKLFMPTKSLRATFESAN